MSISKVHVVLALTLVAASCKAPTVSNPPPANNPPPESRAWMVSTLAGGSRQFWFPIGVTVDSSGNVYAADSNGQYIRKVTADGTVSTLAGSGRMGSTDGPGSSARFNNPSGMAVDSSGNVYVADTLNHRIRKVTADGVVSTLAGSSQGFDDDAGSSAQFYYPYGVAVDSSGNVYVGDPGNNRIRKVTKEGTVSTLAGSGTEGFANGAGSAARFNGPAGVAVDSSGNVYVADSGNNRIRKITAEGEVSTLAGSGTEGFANGAGNTAQFNYPDDVAVDSSGNVYVADTWNHCIRKVTADGAVSTLAGSGTAGFADTDTGSSARFNEPCGVAVDSRNGNVYVADTRNNRIRKIEYKVVP